MVLAIAGLVTWRFARRPTRRILLVARFGGLSLAAAGAYGVVVHVLANMDAAVLDGAVGPTWDTLSLSRRMWMASTGGVGPAPPLSAGALTPTRLAMALATVAHPISSD